MTYFKTSQVVEQHARVKPVLSYNLVIVGLVQHCFHRQEFTYVWETQE